MFVYSVETAGTKARYRLRIAIYAYPTCIRRPALGEFPLEYCYAVWHEKTKVVWLPDSEKNYDDIFIRFDTTHERDRHTDTDTDRRRMTA